MSSTGRTRPARPRCWSSSARFSTVSRRDGDICRQCTAAAAAGRFEVAGPHGRFQIARRWSPTADGEAEEQLTLTAADGARQGDHFIKVLLSER